MCVATATANSATRNSAMRRRGMPISRTARADARRSRRRLRSLGRRRRASATRPPISPAIARPNVASRRVGREDRLDPAAVDDRDAVADRAQLGQLRRGHDQRDALVAVERRAGSRARAPWRRRRCRASARRRAAAVGLERHRARQADLLLVAAREPPHLLARAGAADVERADHLERVAARAPAGRAGAARRSGPGAGSGPAPRSR